MNGDRSLTSISPMCRVLLLTCAIGALMGLLAARAAAHTRDLDCLDFPSQRAAQDHRDVHAGDPDDLDHDEDNTACEELPCPCGATPLPPAPPLPARTPSVAPAAPLTTKARVSGVLDGDTLKVRLAAGAMVNVGLIGVDSPEIGGRGSRGECGGLHATVQLKRLAFRNGRIVTLQFDSAQNHRDHPGRLLAYVSARGVDLGRAMIASGLAKVKVLERDFVRLTTYREAQASAKAAKRGVWRTCG